MSQTRYFSTRGGAETLSFDEAVLTGLAPKGGLYIPTEIPTLPADWETAWSKLSFAELSHAVLSLFIPTDSIPSADLKDIIDRSYATFRSDAVTPLRKTAEGEYTLELWHGPTWAFKDVALQFVGNVFAYLLEKRNAAGAGEQLTVLGATSGDTGSAAIYGLRSKPAITIFILYPDGRVSPIQEAQMATVPDANVYCVSVEDSDFDTCQSIVKSCFSDAAFNKAHRLGAVNSINWARILAQIVYYFAAYFQLPEAERKAKPVNFVVPTGNFGDILAGWYAKRLGLPVGRLVVATNENDILQRFFATGRYERNGADGVKATLSPAMDILLSSNFERLLYYLARDTQEGALASASEAERRAAAQAQLSKWYDEIKATGSADMGAAVQKLADSEFWAERVSNPETLAEINKYYNLAEPYGPYVVDPHTAVGLATTDRSKAKEPNATWITLSTAHPAKFSEAVELALTKETAPGFDFRRDVLPPQLAELETLPKRVYKVKGEDGVRALVEAVKRGEKPTPSA
ncbi:threonine synthase [Vanrija albida]|uniref:Threonine synthase n=1 Tax=Vanrija albida TaxID=181172 RepID=A0ABR3Q974_9TREE